MKNLIYIFLGGGFGSVLRYLISTYTQKFWTVNAFPLGTFLVNILGCFLIGILTSYFGKENSQLKYLLVIGFCGGFTTFSTFSSESFVLWQNGYYFTLISYLLLSVMVGLIAVYYGLQIKFD